MMSEWRTIEVYGSYVLIRGDIEVVMPQRLSDVVNRFGDFVELREATVTPLAPNFPVLARREPKLTIAKAAIVLICPVGEDLDAQTGNPLYRELERSDAAITTQTFSLVADVHLEPRRGLQDHLERYRGDFLPLTNMSALWIATSAETHSLQRPFALLSSAAILSFATR